MKLPIFCVILLVFCSDCTPIVDRNRERSRNEPEFIQPPDRPLDICALPDNSQGKLTLLEDCNHLDLLGDHIPELSDFRGTSVIICCPVPSETSSFIIFKPDFYSYYSDIENDTDLAFGPPDYNYDYPFDLGLQPEAKCSFIPDSNCKTASDCHTKEFTGDEPPTICGWNNELNEHKFCCSGKSVGGGIPVPPQDNDKGYPCEDYHSKCVSWLESAPDSCSNGDHSSFPFMSVACMNTCGMCQNKGCIDEFANCPIWTKKGYCSILPATMSIYCRKSCGSCGFKSVRNIEDQVVDGNSYSDVTSEKFFCGEGKSLDEIGRKRTKRSPQAQTEPNELKLFLYSTEDESSSRGIRCGSVVISDKFALLAAHCAVSFGDPLKSNSVLIRDGTDFEDRIAVKRTFVHPWYRYPNLYNDIAVLQLDRRIDYNYSLYGDSPACLGDGSDNLTNRRATSEGYGFTEDGVTSDKLLTVNVTVISNSNCASYLASNVSTSSILKAQLQRAFPDGVNQQILCTTGIKNNETNVYSGPCEGDSGGPLYVNYGDEMRKRQTVEGIVSGGFLCGRNIPSWYTRVSSYQSWILCIIRESQRLNNADKVEDVCKRFTNRFVPRNFII